MVQYIVKVSDVDRFVTTSQKFAPMMEEMGGRDGGVYEDENDPGLVSTISEWRATTRCTSPPRSTGPVQ
jgi:hypothetical protein